MKRQNTIEEEIILPEEVWVLIFCELPYKTQQPLIILSKQFQRLIYEKCITKIYETHNTPMFFNSKILKQCKALQSLSCFNFYLPRPTLSVIKFLTNLTQLDMPNQENLVDDNISSLTRLKKLDIRGSINISDLSLSKLTNLTYLSLRWNEKVADVSISRLTNLTKLTVDGSNSITDESIRQLTSLKKLSFINNHRLTNESLKPLTNLTDLELLSMDRINFDAYLIWLDEVCPKDKYNRTTRRWNVGNLFCVKQSILINS